VRHLSILFFVFNFIFVLSQNYDSLETIANALKNDSDRVNLFYKEGFEKRTIDVQYSYYCAKQAEYFAQIINKPYYTAKANNLLGILYYRKGDLKKALFYHKTALSLRNSINDIKGIALSQTNLGNIYTDLQEYKLAEQAYLKALELNNNLNNQKQLANGLVNIGVLKVEQNDLDAAVNYFNMANNKAKSINDYEIQAMCLNNMADVYTALHQFDEAIASAQNSIKLKTLMDNEVEMADSYLTIANAYMLKSNIDLALQHLAIADSIINKYDYLMAKLHALIIKYNYYEKIKNYELAFKFLKDHTILQDSLDELNKGYSLESNFDETPLKTETRNSGLSANYGIYYFFGLLFFVALAIVLFVFNFKR
jgi:two-component system NarL family sensor kinase